MSLALSEMRGLEAVHSCEMDIMAGTAVKWAQALAVLSRTSGHLDFAREPPAYWSCHK